MTIPKRNDIAIRNAMARNRQEIKEIPRYDENAEYKHLLWDKEHGQLPLFKISRFKELEAKYGVKQNL